MDENVLRIKEIFSKHLHGFGINHARVYHCLLGDEVMCVKDLQRETSIEKCLLYKILKDMVRENLLTKTRTTPAAYFIEKPILKFNNLIKKQTKLFLQDKTELKKIMKTTATETTKLRITIDLEKKTIIDQDTRKILENKTEIGEIKKLFEEAQKQLPEKKYAMAYAR